CARSTAARGAGEAGESGRSRTRPLRARSDAAGLPWLRATTWCSGQVAKVATTRLLSTAFTAASLQRVTYQVGGQHGQVGFGHGHPPFALTPHFHRCRRRPDPHPPVSLYDPQWRARHEPEGVAQRLGDDDTSGGVEGSPHTRNLPSGNATCPSFDFGCVPARTHYPITPVPNPHRRIAGGAPTPPGDAYPAPSQSRPASSRSQRAADLAVRDGHLGQRADQVGQVLPELVGVHPAETARPEAQPRPAGRRAGGQGLSAS